MGIMLGNLTVEQIDPMHFCCIWEVHKMTDEEKYQKAVKNQERQTKFFRNVLNDRKNIDDEDFDSYCEEMQGALEAEEKAAKKCR